MKTKKLFSLLTTGILATALLGACSSKQSADGNIQGKTTGFMQLANEDKERIWFKVSDSNDDGEISKDDNVDRVFIINNGKADAFHILDATLSDFKGKTDKEIIEIIKQSDKKYVDKEVEEQIGSLNSSIKDSEERIKEFQYEEESQNAPGFNKEAIANENEIIKHRQKRITELEELEYEDIKSLYSNYKIKATVETDSSGNNVASEEILLPKVFEFESQFIYDDPSDSKPLITRVYDISYEIQYQVQGDIYKTFYKGYKLDSSEFLVTTSLDNSINLGLDNLETKNVTEE
ncbi:hypothetical protein [Streptococcus suis]|uniref:hypothetical protein n=1 Tax=Streptococcus suis TaxID=1307 RepID=UPI00049267A1|nr:hypothetical protein [Streptococcus suis]